MFNAAAVLYWCRSGISGSIQGFENHWAKGYIDILCQRNIINGYSNGTFAPNKSLTKAEAAKLICLSAEIQPSSTVDTNLTDINMHWAKKYIAVLPETPNKNGQFQPNTQITRAEFAQMVVGAMYVDTASTDTSALRKRFKDWASIPSESAEFVAVAIERASSTVMKTLLSAPMLR